MAFQISPGVNVSEIDLTTVIPAVATTIGAIGGVFRWGPVEKATLITNENELVSRYGRPTNLNAETFMTAASFLSYSDSLYVSRAFTSNVSFNALASASGFIDANTALESVVKNEDHYDTITSFDADVEWVAKYPGAIGNSLRISVCDTVDAFKSTVNVANNADLSFELAFMVGTNTAALSVTSNTDLDTAQTGATEILNQLSVGDFVIAGNSTVGEQLLKVSAIGSAIQDGVTNTAIATISFSDRYILAEDFVATEETGFVRQWEFFNLVDLAPGRSTYQVTMGNTVNDELHVVVVDEDGEITGVPGTIIEVFEALSRATDAKTEDGGTNYYAEVINTGSKFVWFANHRFAGYSTLAATLNNIGSSGELPYNVSFALGADTAAEDSVVVGDVLRAYDEFKSSEDIDISLIMTGKSIGGAHGHVLPNYVIDNIAEYRKDCVVFISPQRADVVGNTRDVEDDVIEFRNALRSTSYAVLDSGYKYMYDKYNDVYRWVPLNGDIAGLCAYTDNIRDAWFSPAGFNRGQIRNVVKLAWNPKKPHRDVLYKNGVNPIVNFPGQGIIMMGDKTLLSKPSAFDRINVRRLFIVLEKAIATAAKFTLFEFNDDFTRAAFVNLVTPFLRDVQGRRGIYEFAVICDENNNTSEIIDRNEFVGDIYVKPARAINYIQLNFVAVRSGVEFSEIIGNF